MALLMMLIRTPIPRLRRTNGVRRSANPEHQTRSPPPTAPGKNSSPRFVFRGTIEPQDRTKGYEDPGTRGSPSVHNALVASDCTQMGPPTIPQNWKNQRTEGWLLETTAQCFHAWVFRRCGDATRKSLAKRPTYNSNTCTCTWHLHVSPKARQE